ncbi:voltage-dependent calcium channel gamma-like subunit [Aplochiton taeniatus]
MTAINLKVLGGGSVSQRKPQRSFLEVFTCCLIILCTGLAIVLSSVAVSDGHWLQAGGRMFGLWHFCTVDEGKSLGTGVQVDAEVALSNCTTTLTESTGLAVGLGLSRFMVSMAVVGAIFSLELQVISLVSEGLDSAHRWGFGAALVLFAAALSASGVVLFVALVSANTALTGFTLAFWCQFTAVFLLFLSALGASHIRHVNVVAPGLYGGAGHC